MTWPTKKLGEIIELHYGKGIPRHDRKPNGKYPIYGANGELGRTDKYFAEGDALIIGRKGSAGEVIRVSGRFWPSDVSYYVFGNEKVDVDFLFYVLKQLDLKQLATGIKPGVNRNKVYELEIPLPPIEIQKKIVEKIEGLFAKIDEAERLRDESSAASAALLPSALHHIFSRAEKEGWEVKTLDDVAEINPSKKEVVEFRPDTEVSFVPMSAVSETTQSIKRQEVKKLEQVKKGYTYFREGDVLFAKITPCMENGKIIVAKKLKNGIGFGSTEFHVLRAKEMVLPTWLFYFLWNPEFRKEAEENMTGTAGQQRVPADFLKNSKTPLPPIPEQKKITAYLDTLSQKSRALRELQKQTAEDLSALKQSILHQAFGGMA